MNKTQAELSYACMGHTEDERGAGIIVIKNGLVAVSRRLDYSHALQFPGGHIELGEPCLAGIVRELREETGLDVNPGRVLHLFHNIRAIGYTGKAYNACGFLLELNPDEELRNPEPHKHTDWTWVSVASLADVKMIPSSVRCLSFATTNYAHLLH